MTADVMDAPKPTQTDGLPDRPRFWAMAAILTAVGMATLDTAIANTALPTIAGDFHATAADSVWVVNAYQLAVAAAVLPLASLGDLLGQKRVYLAGLALFALSSLACGLSPTLPLLEVARVVQGLGAAAIMSVNIALIRHIYPARIMGRGFGRNALAVAISFAIGPTVTSTILSVATWHWLFLVNVPFCLLALGLATVTLPAIPPLGHRFDGVAALLTAGLFALLVLGMGEAAHAASWPQVAVELAGAALCGFLLLRRQRGHPAPMLAIDLFRNRTFALSALTSVCTFIAQGLAFVALPFLFQSVMGRTAVETGLLITPWSVVVAVMAPIAGKLSDRYPAGILGGLGLAMLCLGMALVALMPSHPSSLDIAWRLGVCGAGFGFFQSPNLKAIMSSAPLHRSGGASGIVATARLLGQSTGAALTAACFGLLANHDLTYGATLALWLGAFAAGAASVASFLRLTVKPQPAA
ncbi:MULTISPECIES: MFS transporter [Nitrospirillum]|uniref:DHA2 family multidrug resistance protein-like MFS transporter n=1 Tax=Nitrospirillum amazonense TaxID=28077 RepID=A0A560GDE3_9PROT|nr:MFS transporter [Nitrospirillum amazonense]MEC4592284.1 MFS transporter [Nitrospirillum amazonense]TWB31932.1 DHA2 family multidrug resistance protein-like MFS transporter [Nitrospirillum amazonense]